MLSYKFYIGFIIIVNIILFIILQVLSGNTELVPGVNNAVFNLAVTIILVFMPMPDAIRFGKKRLEDVKLDIDMTKPFYDYYGSWHYVTTFDVVSPDDGSEEYNLVRNNFNNIPEDGNIEWKKIPLGLIIECGYTKKLDKTDKTETPKVRWLSCPAVITDSGIEWHFEGEIVSWNNNIRMQNTFMGQETYNVVARDKDERPISLSGDLTGFVIINNHCIYLRAKSEFYRL